MAIFIPDFATENLTPEQLAEVLGVFKSLEQLFTEQEAQALYQETATKFAQAEYEILSDPVGHVYLNTGTKLAGEYINPTISATQTAAEVAEEVYDAAVLDKYGNVIYKYSTGQGAMGVHEAGQATKYQATSLMSLDLGMVGAAVAPLLGVAIGAQIEENNPAFWTQLSQKLLPFCYEGTTYIPSWLDIVASAVPGEYECHGIIDKRIYDTIKEWFIEAGYISEYDEHQIDPESTSMVNPVYWSKIDDGVMVNGNRITRIDGTGPIRLMTYVDPPYLHAVVASESPSKLGSRYPGGGWGLIYNAQFSFTYDNKTVYYGDFLVASADYINEVDALVNRSAHQTISASMIAWYLLYGLSSLIANPPVGTSRWGGDSPALELYEKSIIHFIEDPDTHDITLDESDGIEITIQKKKKGFEGQNPSYPSPDPEHEPSPNQTKNPQNALSNMENTAPGNNVNPQEEPQPDPQTDPSITNPTITPVIPVDPPGPGGTEPPPSDGGTGPASIIPVIPLPFSTTNDGLISVYHPTDAQLKAFASWLWVTYADPSIQKLWNNPFDGVIGLMEIYCTPTDIGTKTIRSGFLDSGVSSAIISRYTEINCGTIFIPEYYRNYFDYSPYSKCHIYLPFIGIVELNVDDIVHSGVNCTYKIDEYNGSCIAQLRVAKYTEVNGQPETYDTIMYQFSGNCAVELPLAGGTQSAIRAGMIQAAAYGLSSVVGGIVSGVSGNIGGAVSQIGYGAANAIGSLVSAKSSVQHSGSFGSSFGALGCKTPFIIVTRPKQLTVYNYPELYGYPAHCAVTIGACRGFLRVREVNVKSATATDEEKAKIEELLKEGVYV